MALTIGGRRVGGGPPATPLDPLEAKLADRVARILRDLAKGFDLEAYVQAIAALDPDLLERLLTQVNTGRLSVILEDAFAEVFRTSAESEYDRQARAARKRPHTTLGAPVMIGGADFQYLPRPDVFSYVDERAKMFAQTRAAELVREIDESNRLAIRRIISQAFSIPMTPQQTAKALEDVVGLHTRWADAVVRFKDQQFQRMLREGMTMADASARTAQLTQQYRQRLIRRRAEMIARTEIQQAQNLGRQAGWNASSQTGMVDPASMKEWVTAPPGSRGGPPCDICMGLRGTRVPWNGVFANGQVMPPGHPHCRCTAVLVPPTRGLTGLPSQDLTPWLEGLAAMDAEPVALSKGYQRKFGTISEAARYAANIRWHGTGSPAAGTPQSGSGGDRPGRDRPWTDADTEAVVQRRQELQGDTYGAIPGRGSATGIAMQEITGFDALPRVVSKDELTRLVTEEGWTSAYRGIFADSPEDAQAMADAFRTGEMYAGQGMHGNGTYVSRNPLQAQRYARPTKETGGGLVMRMALKPDAKILGPDDASLIAFKERWTAAAEANARVGASYIFDNPGYYAMTEGYDAIDVGMGSQIMVILNRGALAVQSEDKAYE